MNLEIIICNNFKSRFIGLMGKKEITNILCFPKCNSIHTFFMKTNIDVYMTDKNNNILYFYENLSKNKVILPKKHVYYVYETPVGYKFKEYLNTKKNNT